MARTANRDWGGAGSMISRCPSFRIIASSPGRLELARNSHGLIAPIFEKLHVPFRHEQRVTYAMAYVNRLKAAMHPPAIATSSLKAALPDVTLPVSICASEVVPRARRRSRR